MAYVAPAYNAVDFVATSAAYIAPQFDAVIFTALAELPVKVITGNGALRRIVGRGAGEVKKTVVIAGDGVLRRIVGVGSVSNQITISGVGVLAISGIWRDTPLEIVGDGVLGIRGIGVAGDHACGQ